jgi:CHAT domain-containing protein
MWSLDGSLRYVPLDALYDEAHRQFLIEQYAMTVFTPASNSRLKDVPLKKWSVAAFGVTKSHEGFAPLPAVRQELTGIAGSGTAPGILPGVTLLDEQFTEKALDSTVMGHSVTHIASHFRLQPGDESNSYLLLGDGTHLTMADFKNKDQIFGGVDLLTLSACNTGVGSSGGNGQEVEGFGVLAQRKGAKAVLATLWSVADDSTSQLMQELYRIRESSPGVTKLDALRRAQLALLRGSHKASAEEANRGLVLPAQEGDRNLQHQSFVHDPEAPYAHPYYWAPFFLMGNWQ